MRFRVPQFIDVEDKIFGPFTFKQFVYLGGGAGAALALWFLVPIRLVAILLALPIVALALALALYKYNGKPFSKFLESLFTYTVNSKLYIWKKRDKKPQAGSISGGVGSSKLMPQLNQSNLKNLTWELDVADSSNAVSKKQNQSAEEGEKGVSKSIRNIEERRSMGGKNPTL